MVGVEPTLAASGAWAMSVPKPQLAAFPAAAVPAVHIDLGGTASGTARALEKVSSSPAPDRTDKAHTILQGPRV